MARAKKKPRIKDKACVGPARNLTVSKGSISRSVDVDSVQKKASLDSISCGLVSCGRSDAHHCVGPAINFSVLDGSISCSVQLDSVQKAGLDSISCGLVPCGHSDAQQQCHQCCVGPAINFTVSEGSISCSVKFDSVKKASLVSISRGSVVCGRSDAHGINYRQISKKPPVPKTCTGSSIKKGEPNNNKTSSNTFVVDNQTYNINFQNKSNFDEFECVMHSIKSWKHTAQVKALAVYMAGCVPKNRYVREDHRKFQPNPSKWIICDACKRGVCIECALVIRRKIMNDRAIPKTIKKMDVWCQIILLSSK
jgi:hypothetical protein